MIRRHWAYAAVVLSLFGLGHRAWAQGCGPPVALASLDMASIPGGAAMSVPIVINGVRKNLLLATGGGVSTLTAAAGETLALKPQYNAGLRFLDTDGYASHRYFDLDSVGLGNMHARNMTFIVTANPNFGKTPPLDGVLAADMMQSYDVEIDFAARKLNFFSQDHCPGQFARWPAAIVGTVPITVSRRADDLARSGQTVHQGILDAMDHLSRNMPHEETYPLQGVDIRTTVTLNGKEFAATIDTGAENSSLNAVTAAAVYGVGAPAAAATVAVHGATPYVHTFHDLTFGGVTVTNPHFAVRPDATGIHDPDNGRRTGSRIARVDDFPRPEVIIGMDVLKRLHLYFAIKEGKLYVTPADAAAATR